MVDEKFIDETIAFWSPRYGYEISREDAREIVENMTGVMKLLMEWDAEDKAEAEGETESVVVSKDVSTGTGTVAK